MIEIWNGQSDMRPLAEQWASECKGKIDVEQGMRDLISMKECVNSDVIILNINGPVGVMGIQILDMFFTKDCYSAVRYWYVKPEFRFMARGMITFAQRWSREMACEKMLVCSNKLSVPCDEFYKAMGFKEFETVYIGDI